MAERTMEKTIAFRVPMELYLAVQKLAGVLGVKPSDIVRWALPEREFFDMSVLLKTLPPIPLLLDGGLRECMKNDDGFPVIAEQLANCDKLALFELFVAWHRAKAGKGGYRLEKVVGEGNVVLGWRVMYSSRLPVAKGAIHKKSVTETLAGIGVRESDIPKPVLEKMQKFVDAKNKARKDALRKSNPEAAKAADKIIEEADKTE